jgi:transposase
MNKQTIYPQRSQELAAFFSTGTPPEKLLIVPMDFAKGDHTAQFCRATGEFLLQRPLTVYNTAAGADYLENRIQAICRKYHISRNDVLIGGEDPPPYVFNFIHRLLSHDFPFVRVNPHEAKLYRTNCRASSDAIDLGGVAQAILLRRARDLTAFDDIYRAMKSASRNRRKLVKEETAVKNRIHQSVDILFPGFLHEASTGVVPFTHSSLWLMEENFSVVKIKRMTMDSLVKGLRRHRTHKPEEAARKLKALANQALPPPPGLIAYTSKSLAAKVDFLRTVRQSLAMEETELARGLVQTPGFYLTTVPGIGVVLAGGMVAEYGPVNRWPAADNMASYAGIVPREKQSGGKEKMSVKGHLPLDCNRILKDWLLQSAYHVGTTPHPVGKVDGHKGDHRLLQHYQRVENREGKSRLSTAKMLIKIGRQMVTKEREYLPTAWLPPHPPPPQDELLVYLDSVRESLQEKWKGYDLTGIDDDPNYLIQWQEFHHELTQFAVQ